MLILSITMGTSECLNGSEVVGCKEVQTLMARLYKTAVDTPFPSVQTATFWPAQQETMMGTGAGSGQVRVYSYNGSEWVQIGEDIDGESMADFFGESVSLSSDGSILAVGAASNDAGGSNAGNVRVFAWDGSSWVQIGQSIIGESAGDRSGSAVSLSSNGLLLAIGSPGNSGGGIGRGIVRVYAWTGTAWVQRGSDIKGENDSSASGTSVSLNSAGDTLAIGAISNTNFNGISSGHVRVFEWSGSEWLQKGCDLDGEGAGDLFGGSVSLSGDGNKLVVGGQNNDEVAPNSGHARIYMWTGSVWVQNSVDLDGVVANDKFGSSVSVSGDGNAIVVGARGAASGRGLQSTRMCAKLKPQQYILPLYPRRCPLQCNLRSRL